MTNYILLWQMGHEINDSIAIVIKDWWAAFVSWEEWNIYNKINSDLFFLKPNAIVYKFAKRWQNGFRIDFISICQYGILIEYRSVSQQPCFSNKY